MRWIDRAFKDLTAPELYAMLALRQRVFVVEQTCAYLDADGLDPQCRHLWAQVDEDGSGESAGSPTAELVTVADLVIVAYLRIVPAGLRFAEVSIGRVVTASQVRGIGLGRELMQRGLAVIRAHHGPVPVRVAAQAQLERFYGELGFVRASANFDEDGIPHLEMLRVNCS